MKRFAVTAVLCAASAFLALPASAAELKATIPFAFHLGDTVLPAGDYRIQTEAVGSVMLFRNALGKPAAFASTRPVERSGSEKTGVLVFNRIGSHYFLAGLWAPNAQTGVKPPQSAYEKEAYARTMETKVASVSIPTR